MITHKPDVHTVDIAAVVIVMIPAFESIRHNGAFFGDYFVRRWLSMRMDQ